MNTSALFRNPLTRLLSLAGILIVSVGFVRVLYVEPRTREAAALDARRAGLEAQLQDLTRGVSEMAVWSKEHPGEDAMKARHRKALPARAMVPAFLEALDAIAERHGIATESITPAETIEDVSAPDEAGRPVALRRAELRFRISGSYRGLAAYVKDVESLDQLVLIRSLDLRLDPARYPGLAADAVFWVHGIP
ncbi:MAG TPA: type 4a pilus biogenesis protein PilO [Candidatus Eisenbacteria bacterium]|nr:type 4a pilus biogenesis protein PilO [Candidatus Eisenbacteria bacterium]